MEYRKLNKYKYQLLKEVTYTMCDSVRTYVETDWVILNGDKITIKKGYCWDGASGPTIDTDTCMEASLVHDALCQLIRLEIIPADKRKQCDIIFRDLCKRAGMNPVRYNTWYRMLRMFGSLYSSVGKPQDKIFDISLIK